MRQSWSLYGSHQHRVACIRTEFCFIVEQPADKGDPASPVYRPGCADWPHLFDTEPFHWLRDNVPTMIVTFPQCPFDPNGPQKLTDLLCTLGVGRRLTWIQRSYLVLPRGCCHQGADPNPLTPSGRGGEKVKLRRGLKGAGRKGRWEGLLNG